MKVAVAIRTLDESRGVLQAKHATLAALTAGTRITPAAAGTASAIVIAVAVAVATAAVVSS